ncbi:hypothetical protein [Halocatena marina]|uniref:DUF35 domain-containing protein n=1 Tax=Halocatena marina TaxID=2934937 RepID=A0ABD5YRN5_9EURY|nr:hypothetical protein [Halocatena marina]
MNIVTALRRELTNTTPTERSPYKCGGCGMRFELQRHVCPACGGYTIERTEWPCLSER